MRKLTTGAIAWLMAVAVGWAASPPDTLNYQGVLRDSDGNPIDGTRSMVFRFFDDETDGDELLVDTHPEVVVSGGLFSVRLGTGAVEDGSGTGNYLTLATVFADHANVFLQVEVTGETLQPRIPVDAAAYALNARRVRGQEIVTDGPLDLYVDAATGDDADSGLEPDRAKRTIQSAIDAIPLLVANQVTIHIAEGTYVEELSLHRATTNTDLSLEGIPIILEGNPESPESVNLSGGGGILTRGLLTWDTFLQLRGIRIIGFSEYGIELGQNGLLLVDDCIISNIGGVGVRIESWARLARTQVTGTTDGIRAEGGQLEMEDSVVENNTGRGVWVNDGRAHLERTTFQSNAGTGLHSEGSSISCQSGMNFLSNGTAATAWDNGLIRFSDGGSAVFSGNTFELDARRHSSILGYGQSGPSCAKDTHSVCDPSN